MPDKILHKRNLTSGNAPTTASLEPGELAINVADGKLFLRQSGSIADQIVTVGLSASYAQSASFVLPLNQTVQLTGSFNVSGSTTQIGNNNLLGQTNLSGSIIISGSVNALANIELGGTLRLDPTLDPGNTNATASFLFTSASNTAQGYDLYYRQNGNIVKFKWLEGGISSGLLYGGIISASGATIYVSSGSGIILDPNASFTKEISPQFIYVTWPNYSASATYLTSSQNTYLYVDNAGTINQQVNFFDQTQYEQSIPLGRVTHPNYATITGIGSNVQTTYDSDSQQSAFIRAFGPLKVSGFSINAQSGSLRFGIGSGIAYTMGGFYPQDPNSPSHYNGAAFATSSIARAYRSGSGINLDNNGGAFYTTVDTNYWDDGTGVLNAMTTGSWQIQRVFANPVTGRATVYYGQNIYTTLLNALQGLSTDSFTEGEFTANSLIFVGYLVLKGQDSNLADTVNNRIINSGIFRNIVGGSSGGGAVAQNLDELGDVTITTPSNGQALIYNGGTWINGTPSLASSATTASYVLQAVSASYATTASFINSTGTNAFTQNGNSFGTSALLGTNDNQSLAFETNGVTRMFVSSSGLVGVRTTNPEYTFDVSGSIRANGSFIFATDGAGGNGLSFVRNSNNNWTWGSSSPGIGNVMTIAGNTIGLPQVVTTSNGLNVTPGGNSSGQALGVTVGAYPAATLATFSSGSVTALTISGSGIRGTGSFAYSGNIIATSFTGSLFGTASYADQALSSSFASTVPAAGVIGLNLSQIATGSVTASVSPTQFTVTSGSSTELVVTGTGVTIGSAITDNHSVTGSLGVTGSINGLLFGIGNGNVSSNVSIGATTAFSSSATGGNNIAIGSNSLSSNTNGCDNTAIGVDALRANTTGYRNVAIGPQTLCSNITGDYNTAIGFKALSGATGGNDNIAMGRYSLCSNVTGNHNIAIGRNTLGKTTSGDNNIALGNTALYNNTTGVSNTAVGLGSLQSNTGGVKNTAIGVGNLASNTTGNYGTAIGYNALRNNTTGNDNIAIGNAALRSNTTGFLNIAIGRYASRYTTTGTCNIVFGYMAAKANSSNANLTSLCNSVIIGANTKPSASGDTNEIVIGDAAVGLGSNTTVIGNSSTTQACIFGQLTAGGFTGSLFGTASFASTVPASGVIGLNLSQITSGSVTASVSPTQFTVTSGSSTELVVTGTGVTIGNALTDNHKITGSLSVTGSINSLFIGLGNGNVASNVSIGATTAFSSSNTGFNNVAIGSLALCNNTSGNYNTAIGPRALRANTTGCNNSAIGPNTLQSNTTGQYNTAIGTQALINNTTGCFNNAIGRQSLGFNTTGGQNTAIGLGALQYNTTANSNIAIGTYALRCNTTGYSNTAIGNSALRFNTTGGTNVALGPAALQLNCTGQSNVAVGRWALINNSTGCYNTAIGRNALLYFNASNNIAVGKYALRGTYQYDPVAESSCKWSGGNNIALGSRASYLNTTGCYNTAIGICALSNNTTGNFNVVLGRNAASANSTSNAVTSLSSSIIIGTDTKPLNTTGDINEIVIGANAVGLGSNTTVIGNSSTTRACIFGQLTATSFTGSLQGTASLALGVVGGVSAFPFTGSARITGSLGVTGSISTTGSNGTINDLFIGRGRGNVSTNISIGGSTAFSATSTGTNNTSIGSGALINNTSGCNNTAIGCIALSTNQSGTNNTAIGANALASNTSGGNNAAIGYRALQCNTTGTNNVAIGCYSLYCNTTGACNTAIGKNALRVNTTGNRNIAIGYNTLRANTTGATNVAMGYQSLCRNTFGLSNVAIGCYTLHFNTTGCCNVAVGSQALQENTTGTNNVALGAISLWQNTSGCDNTAIGYCALRSNTTACNNTAIGRYALRNNTTGCRNTAIGRLALCTNTTGNQNVAIGFYTLRCNTTGLNNISIGYSALRYNTTATYNIAIGCCALFCNTTGGSNTALGSNALRLNTTSNFNTAIGHSALRFNTGQENTAIGGAFALYRNTSGIRNTAVGNNALRYNTIGNCNVAVGYSALRNSSTAVLNTAVGYRALYCNTTGGANVSIGFKSMGSNTTGANNIAIGYQALTGNTIGQNNITLGYKASCTVSGNNNIVIGTNISVSSSAANQINIGALIFGSGSFSNAAAVPNFTGSANGFVGINQPNPQYNLDVSGSFGLLQSAFINQNTASLASGTRTISTNATGSFNAAFYNYVLLSGSNARAGQVMSVWNGSSIQFTDVTTTDIGSTAAVALTASLSGANVVLSSTLPTSGWSFETVVNLI
jgi:hypothetical protein